MSVINPSVKAPSADVASAIAIAARRADVDADYLLRQAGVESGFDPMAKAASSSASGLFQFIEQTWLGIVKTHGEKHGLGWAADRIGRDAGGRYSAGADTARILALRFDAPAASAMAAEFAADNRNELEAGLGRSVESTDLYLAHFLGARRALDFLRAHDNDPGMRAAALFPTEARANPSIFFARSGGARSIGEVRTLFARKLGNVAASTPAVAPATSTAAAPRLTDAWLSERTAVGGASMARLASARLMYALLGESALS
jgi:hypothetical protein